MGIYFKNSITVFFVFYFPISFFVFIFGAVKLSDSTNPQYKQKDKDIMIEEGLKLCSPFFAFVILAIILAFFYK